MKSLRLIALLITPWLIAQEQPAESSTKPRFESAINQFVEDDKANPPPQNAILISGSSSAKFWVTAAEDFKPYPVINRGFGGSKTSEVLAYMDKITLPYHPRVVIYFAGTNDLGGGTKAPVVLENIRLYIEKLRQENPNCGVVVMAALKAPKRKSAWEEIDKFNKLLSEFCSSGTNLYYVDHNAVINKPNGEPIPEFYREEGENAMHASPAGYVEIVKIVRPVVDRAWKTSKPAVTSKIQK